MWMDHGWRRNMWSRIPGTTSSFDSHTISPLHSSTTRHLPVVLVRPHIYTKFGPCQTRAVPRLSRLSQAEWLRNSNEAIPSTVLPRTGVCQYHSQWHKGDEVLLGVWWERWQYVWTGVRLHLSLLWTRSETCWWWPRLWMERCVTYKANNLWPVIGSLVPEL